MSYFDDVTKFHQEILGMPPTKPHLLSLSDITARIKFLEEELEELRNATRNSSIVGAADALADLVYVALGTAYQMGLPFDLIWTAVQSANMAKVPGMTKRGMSNDAVKPEGWVGPEAAIEFAISYAAKS